MPSSVKKTYWNLLPQMIFAGLISGVFIYLFFEPAFINFILGFIVGILCHFFIATFEMYLKPKLSKRNFLLALLTSTFSYIILIVIAVFIALIIINNFRFKAVVANFESILLSDAMIYGVSFGLLLSFVFSTFSMFEMLLGKNFLFKLFTGKYHTPFEEERVFMFLDLKSSTTLAEKLGHKAFLGLLNDFFYDVSVAVSGTKGEIYKYVGDEAIITWKQNRMKRNSNPVTCFFQIEQEVEKKRQKYIRKHGVVPEFKAGVHGGFVVTGEMGYVKKEIAFLGDVLNTTARIESLCNLLGRKILVSDEILEKIDTSSYRLEALGEQKLKGKEKAVKISAIHLA